MAALLGFCKRRALAALDEREPSSALAVLWPMEWGRSTLWPRVW